MKLEAVVMVVLVLLVPGSPADGLQETALSSTCVTQQTDRWDRMGERGVVSFNVPGFEWIYLHAPICLADHGWIMYLAYVTLNSINFQLWTITFLV